MTSPAMPQGLQSESATTSRPVFPTEARMVSEANGRSVRTSRTSAESPACARACAAFSDSDTMGPTATTVTSRPWRTIAARPMVSESLKAAQALEQAGLSAEVIDVRTLRPLDSETILASVGKTGRLVVADSDWSPCGIAGEVIARVAETAFDALKARPVRVTWPDTPVPSSETIEAQFYPGAREIQVAATRVCESRADKGV